LIPVASQVEAVAGIPVVRPTAEPQCKGSPGHRLVPLTLGCDDGPGGCGRDVVAATAAWIVDEVVASKRAEVVGGLAGV
jgi:hypothetical protein